MKRDIILAGVGGQGILSIATVLGAAALEQGLFLKQSEVHGMSQRGGDVQANLRISSNEIHSDLIPLKSADLIISLEPMEALRYLPFLSANGKIISSCIPFVNIDNYPNVEDLLKELDNTKQAIVIDVEKVANDCGNPRGANMVLLGAAIPFLDMSYEKIEQGVKTIFASKGEKIVEDNLKTLRAGFEISK